MIYHGSNRLRMGVAYASIALAEAFSSAARGRRCHADVDEDFFHTSLSIKAEQGKVYVMVAFANSTRLL